MAHLHGERAFGTGGGTSNQNLMGALDRDSGDSSGSADDFASRPGSGGTPRMSAGSDLESFEEHPELEARLRESSRRLPSVDLENAPPIPSGSVTAPLQFAGIVSATLSAHALSRTPAGPLISGFRSTVILRPTRPPRRRLSPDLLLSAC